MGVGQTQRLLGFGASDVCSTSSIGLAKIGCCRSRIVAMRNLTLTNSAAISKEITWQAAESVMGPAWAAAPQRRTTSNKLGWKTVSCVRPLPPAP